MTNSYDVTSQAWSFAFRNHSWNWCFPFWRCIITNIWAHFTTSQFPMDKKRQPFERSASYLWQWGLERSASNWGLASLHFFRLFYVVVCKLDLVFCFQSNGKQAVKKQTNKKNRESSYWQGLELQLLRPYRQVIYVRAHCFDCTQNINLICCEWDVAILKNSFTCQFFSHVKGPIFTWFFDCDDPSLSLTFD